MNPLFNRHTTNVFSLRSSWSIFSCQPFDISFDILWILKKILKEKRKKMAKKRSHCYWILNNNNQGDGWWYHLIWIIPNGHFYFLHISNKKSASNQREIHFHFELRESRKEKNWTILGQRMQEKWKNVMKTKTGREKRIKF